MCKQCYKSPVIGFGNVLKMCVNLFFFSNKLYADVILICALCYL
jgi:hypothetical protein